MKAENENLNKPQKPQSIVGAVMRGFLYKYVNWERIWFKPKCKFIKGDRVKINWKAKMYFKGELIKPLPTEFMIFDKIDKDNVVDMENGDTWNLYWLCRA